MRSSRLVAILMDLARGSGTSVARLAARHEVSTRTIQRDLVALHTMGVPVWTRTGPAGGVGLVDGWRSPLTGMTTRELRALVIGESVSGDLGLGSDFAAARLKLLGPPSGGHDDVEAAYERFLVDNHPWFSPTAGPPLLPAVSRAVWTGRRVTITYQRPGSRSPTVRLIDPLGLVLKVDVWYLVAAHGEALRTYRVSRIATCEIHDEPARRPAGFTLGEYWTTARAEFESTVFTRPVRLALPEESVDVLLAAVPGPDTQRSVESAEFGAGRVELELPMESDQIALAQLAGVPGVEILAPLGLRTALAEHASAIAERNRIRPDEQVSRRSPG